MIETTGIVTVTIENDAQTATVLIEDGASEMMIEKRRDMMTKTIFTILWTHQLTLMRQKVTIK